MFCLKGHCDFNDYDSEYEEQHPELGFTDEQVEAEVAKLDPEDKKFYEEYREFLDTYYRQHGKIIEMPDLIKLIMTGRYPEIPSTTRKEQDELWEKLLIETRKREMSQQAGLEEEPPRKIRRIVPERVGKIIDVVGDDNPDAPTIIKITPGVDPYMLNWIWRKRSWSTRLEMRQHLKYIPMMTKQTIYPA